MLDKDLLAAYRAILADRPVCPSGTTHIGVIDADLQHDEAALPEMATIVLDKEADKLSQARDQCPGGT